uniref:Uncharacterized protein n=1 Tax=Arundo donax TaxID=35708 RepID=A0A0A9BZD1_ARUDO
MYCFFFGKIQGLFDQRRLDVLAKGNAKFC